MASFTHKFKHYMFDPKMPWFVMVALFVAEIVVNILVIHKIKCACLKFVESLSLLTGLFKLASSSNICLIKVDQHLVYFF